MAVMKTAIFIIILIFTHQVWSQDLSADFKKLLIANKLPSQNQIFCLKHKNARCVAGAFLNLDVS